MWHKSNNKYNNLKSIRNFHKKLKHIHKLFLIYLNLIFFKFIYIYNKIREFENYGHHALVMKKKTNITKFLELCVIDFLDNRL